MALPTVASIEQAVTDVFGALKDAKFRDVNTLGVLLSFQEVMNTVQRLYVPKVTVTTTADAGVSEAIAATGCLGLAWGTTFPGGDAPAFPVGETFVTTGTVDFTGTPLATAKGSALAAGDIFQVTGADAVTFIGTAAPDFSAEEVADY